MTPTNPDLRVDGTPTTWTTGNDVVLLKDGETLFPLLTDAINQASTSIHFMNMNFWLGKNLVTKFIPDPPPDNVPVNGLRVHEILKSKATTLTATNVLVQDIPFFGRKNKQQLHGNAEKCNYQMGYLHDSQVKCARLVKKKRARPDLLNTAATSTDSFF